MNIVIRKGQTEETMSRIRQGASRYYGLAPDEIFVTESADEGIPDPNANAKAFAGFLVSEYGLNCHIPDSSMRG